MMKTIALIKDTEVVNVVIVADGKPGTAEIAYLNTQYDAAIDVTTMDPQPGINTGWHYIEGSWVAPVIPEPEPETDPEMPA